MSESHKVPAATLDLPGRSGVTHETASRTSTLITESEVAFSTAAAVPVRPSTAPWWSAATRVVVAAVHRIFPPFPPRRRYLDDAVMAREMYRL